MQPPIDPLSALPGLNLLHITITLSLFLINVVITQAIGRQRLIARANYLGPEMTYLAVAIVVSQGVGEAPDLLIAIVAVFPYLALWAVGLFLTKRVIEVDLERLHPLTVVNLLAGSVAVFLSLNGTVEALLRKGL